MSSGDEEEKTPAPTRPTGGMSRFLRTAGSDSSSSDSEDEDSEDSSGDDGAAKSKRKKSKYTFGSDDEPSDDEVKRVVKSAKDKRFEEMEASTKVMENALKINDWVVISNGKCAVLAAPFLTPCRVR